MRLLIVEDDRRLADVLRRSLAERGHAVEVADDGARGLQMAQAGAYDVAILDVMLPVQDGLSVVRSLRADGNHTPILMLTARDTVDDIVAGLDAGADDYVVKPFELAEIEARLRSLARRSSVNKGKILRAYDIAFDLAAMRVYRGERCVALTVREMAFLEFFMRNQNQVLTRPQIEDALWDEHRDSGASNIIDVYIGRLRAKLAAGNEAQLIHTVRGRGYRFGLAETPEA